MGEREAEREAQPSRSFPRHGPIDHHRSTPHTDLLIGVGRAENEKASSLTLIP